MHDLRTNQGTANNNGYSIANHIEQNEFMQDTATAISSLENSVQADSEAFAKMQEQLTELVKIVTAIQLQYKTEPKNQSGGRKKKKKYCWTHGFQHSHESPACKFPLEAHVKEETAENTMGGCQTGKWLLGPVQLMNNVINNLFSTDSPQDCVDYIADSGCTEHYVPETVGVMNETYTKNI